MKLSSFDKVNLKLNWRLCKASRKLLRIRTDVLCGRELEVLHESHEEDEELSPS